MIKFKGVMFKSYTQILTKHPILTQSIVTACLFGAGDGIAQQIIERRGIQSHDFARTARMVGYGGVIAGPALSHWYRFLEKNIQASTPVRRLVTKVAADQIIFAPLFIGVFFSVQGFLEGKSTNEVKQKLQTSYTPALASNYKVWPAVQVLNFYFTPLNHRLLVTNLVALGWNSYLSIVNRRAF